VQTLYSLSTVYSIRYKKESMLPVAKGREGTEEEGDPAASSPQGSETVLAAVNISQTTIFWHITLGNIKK
jgi:hypothetical protein